METQLKVVISPHRYLICAVTGVFIDICASDLFARQFDLYILVLVIKLDPDVRVFNGKTEQTVASLFQGQKGSHDIQDNDTQHNELCYTQPK